MELCPSTLKEAGCVLILSYLSAGDIALIGQTYKKKKKATPIETSLEFRAQNEDEENPLGLATISSAGIVTEVKWKDVRMAFLVGNWDRAPFYMSNLTSKSWSEVTQINLCANVNHYSLAWLYDSIELPLCVEQAPST